MRSAIASTSIFAAVEGGIDMDLRHQDPWSFLTLIVTGLAIATRKVPEQPRGQRGRAGIDLRIGRFDTGGDLRAAFPQRCPVIAG